MKVTAKRTQGYQVEIITGNHRLIADEPAGIGQDEGPDPYGLLLAALAACKVMTVAMYAERKGWDVEGVEVELDIQKIFAKDCEDCESDPNARVDVIEEELTFRGDLEPEQVARLAAIADKCPVHRTLTSETRIRQRSVAVA